MIKHKIENFINRIVKNSVESLKFQNGCSHLNLMNFFYKDVVKLNEVEMKIFSQNGEDGIIDYLTKQLNIAKPKFLEIGIGDYSESNTRFIYERTSPKGMVVDCINDLEKKIKKKVKIWKGDLKIINKEINSSNALQLLNKDNMLHDLDLFSIDIDGIDYWILDKLPKHFSKIVVLEYNPIFGFDLEVSVPNISNFDRTKYHYSNLCFGMSFRAAVNLMDKKGFYFVGSNFLNNNAFFVSKKYKKNIYFKNLKIDKTKSNIESNFRESRDKNKKLNYLSGKNKLKEILDCKIINLRNKKKNILKIKNLISNIS
jgi:hypothetical protein